MSLRLRSPLHHAPDFRFFSLYTQGKRTFGILAWLPQRFLHTVAYGMCSVPPHIPYPSASLRERSYASVAPHPLPAASTFPLLFQFTFSQKFSFLCGSTGSLKSAFIIGGLSILGEQVSPEHLKTHFVAFELLRLT